LATPETPSNAVVSITRTVNASSGIPSH
jgi:hypothetical protein